MNLEFVNLTNRTHILYSIIFVTLVCFINTSVQNKEIEECDERISATGDKYCSSDKKIKDVPNFAEKYSKELNENWTQLLSVISEAEKKYEQSEEWTWLNRKTDAKGDCSLYENQIDEDLKPFKNGIYKKMIDAGMSRGTLYQIRNGKLVRDKECKFPARCKGVEHFLMEIAKDLPDTEFILNTSDWPQVSSHFPDPIPIFSFSKTTDYADITYPAWTFWAGGPSTPVYPQGLGRWDLMRKRLLAAAKTFPWKDKIPKAFFRGSRTSHERDPLIYVSRSSPHLVDAQYTKNQAWKSEADTLHAPAAEEITLENHCQYKYLFNYRGVAASFRFKHLFLCNSLVFHVGNEWIEFFYPKLLPWIHYIPVDKNAKENDIKSLLLFIKNNDKIAQKIANRGYKFVKKHLQMDHIRCYWKKLIIKYSTFLKYTVIPRNNLITTN